MRSIFVNEAIGEIDFPDSMTDDDINQAVRTILTDSTAAPTVPTPPVRPPPQELDTPFFAPTSFQDSTRVAEGTVSLPRPPPPAKAPIQEARAPVTPRVDSGGGDFLETAARRAKPGLFTPEFGAQQVERQVKNVGAGAAGTIGGMAGAADWVFDSDLAKDLVVKAAGWRKELSPSDPKLLDQVAQGFGSMATFYLPGAGFARGAGLLSSVAPKVASWMGASFAAALESLTEAGSTYTEVLDASGDKEKASDAAMKTFLLNIPLDAVTNKLGVFGDKGGAIRRSVLSSLSEGLQEAGQETISAVAAGREVDPEQVKRAGLVGGIVGGGTSAIAGGGGVDTIPGLTEAQNKEVVIEKTKLTPDQVLGRGQAAPVQMQVSESPETTQVGQLQTEEIVRKSKIVRDLSEKLEVPIRTGNFRQRAFGIFKTGPKVIRLRKAQDIDTLAHEAGHLIHREAYSASKTKLQDSDFSAWSEELDKFAPKSIKKGKRNIEGFAEFVRLYVTDPSQAQKSAPRFFNDFETRLSKDNPAMLDTMLKAREDFDRWNRMPAVAKVMSQISFDESVKNKPEFDDLYTKFIDKLHPLEVAVEQITGGQEIPVSDNPYILARLNAGWTGKADSFLQHSTLNQNTYEFTGKPLKQILDPIKSDIKNFTAYLVAKRSVELSGRGIETGIRPKDARTTIKELESEGFKAAANEVATYQNSLLEYLKDGGILSDEQFGKIKAANENYVPFYRWTEAEKGQGKQKGFANLFSPVKRIKGSALEVVDPLESIIKNTYSMIEVVERNEIGKALARLSEVEGSGKYVEKIPAPVLPTKINLKEVIGKAAKARGIEGLDLSQFDNEIVEVFRPSSFTPKENTIAVWNKGKKSYYQVDPKIYETMLSIGEEGTNIVTKILSKPASLLRAGATLSPGFIGRNPVRDQWSAYLFSKYGYKPGVDFTRGLAHMLKNDEMYWNWKISGGEHSMLVSMDRTNLQKNLGDLIQKNPAIRNTIKSPIEALRILSEHMETGTRLGEFSKATKAEGTGKEALLKSGFASREVTLDFARIGSSMRALNQVVAFQNAGIQGIDKFAREAKNNPGRLWPRVLAGVTLPSLILYAINKDDEEIQELPQWERDLFWIARATPNQLIRIPKNFEVGVAFGSVPERMLDWYRTNDPAGFKKSMDTLSQALLPAAIPTALVPIGENFANKSSFTGRPIVPRGKEKLEPFLQAKDYTSEVSKLIGKAVNYSPAKIDNIIFGFTGGLGRLAAEGIDGLLEAFGIVDLPPQPERTLSDIPGLKAFVPRFPTGSTESIERFYKDYNEAQKVHKSLKALVVKGDQAEIQAYLKKNKALLNKARFKELKGIAKQLSGLRKSVRSIYQSRKFSPKEKRQKLNAIYIEMTNTARSYLGKKPLLSLQVRR